MDELDRIKKRLKKEFEKDVEINPDSDLPISEKKTEQKKVLGADEEESKEEE